MNNERSDSAAWQQFLLGKRAMLDEYDRARAHARTQVVQTHHGNVGEAAFRDWLSTFLPKRYGVTAGYIRSQKPLNPHQSAHFDVIIYDQLESPVLWVEENKDKAESGRARIIPAEYVGAILEVKAAFNRRYVSQAVEKLTELAPLMVGIDPLDEPFPKYLRRSAMLGIICFELRRDDANDEGALHLIRDASFARGFYGAVVLRGEGRNPDDTAHAYPTVSEQPQELRVLNETTGLLSGCSCVNTNLVGGRHQGTWMLWTDINFAQFAFDLLAFLKGSYQPGRVSSFHGFDFSRQMS